MRTITAKEVQAANQAADGAPALFAMTAAAVTRRSKRHPNPEEVAADALALAALYIPEHFRNGTASPWPQASAEKVAEGAARNAIGRALARRQEEAARLDSLDALAEIDPQAVEAALTQQAERHGTAQDLTSATPNPAAPWTERPERHAVMAALTIPDGEAGAALALAVSHYLDAASTHRGDRLPSLAGATAHALGLKPDDRAAKKHRAAVRAALAQVEPYADRIMAAPAERTTSTAYPITWCQPAQDARPTWSPRAVALATLAREAQREQEAAQRADQAARPTRPEASPVVVRTRLGYPEALGYDTVRIQYAGETVATYPAQDWTPEQTAAVLAHMTQDTPDALTLAPGITAREAAAGERAALFQPAAPRKQTSRKPNRVGAVGPMTSDQPARTAVPRYAEQPTD